MCLDEKSRALLLRKRWRLIPFALIVFSIVASTLVVIMCLASSLRSNRLLIAHIERLGGRVEQRWDGEIRGIWLDGTAVCDSDLGLLRDCRKVQFLSLHHTRISDHAMQFISDLTELRHLDLSETSVTDKGMPALANLTRMETLELTGTRVSDESLALLEAMPNLKYLVASYTAMTPEGLERLQQKVKQNRRKKD
jgi:hypothetical protein